LAQIKTHPDNVTKLKRKPTAFDPLSHIRKSYHTMSAYAILGATGSTGSSILHLLSASPKNQIKLLVRSKAKLQKISPSSLSKPNIQIFESSISDTSTLTQCLAATKAVFLTVAVTDNMPGTTISLDTAKAVISALQSLREEDPKFKAPRLIVLSSASLDDKFWTTTPDWVHNLLWNCMSHIYNDLRDAEAYLRKHQDWLSVTFMMPGGIVHDVQRGHELSTSGQQTFVSFLDVAGAMIEVADCEGDRWDGQNVSLVLKGEQRARFEWWAPVVLAKGLVVHYAPWMYAWLQ
jgi:putative NADH-flavin reductase